MQSALQLLIFWGLAFVTLVVALLLLSIFFALIEDDLTLRGVGKETTIAAVASLVEGASVWAVVTFIPLAGPFLAARFFIPALIVGLIYKPRTSKTGAVTKLFCFYCFNWSFPPLARS
jgi:hypothetical protein